MWPWWGLFEGTCVASVCVLSRFSRVQLFATPWTVPSQAPLSMGFSRQEHCSGLPFLSPGHCPDPGREPTAPAAPALAGVVFTTVCPGSPRAAAVLRLLLSFSLSVTSNSVIPLTAVHQASLDFTISWSLLKLMYIESVVPSNYLILCCPLVLLPSASGYFPMSQLAKVGASASALVLPINIQS